MHSKLFSCFHRLSCDVCSTIPNFSSIDAEFFHAIEQRAAFYPQSKGRAAWSTDATFRLTQHTNDPSLLLEVAYNFDCIYSAGYSCRQRNIESSAGCENY
jgi:hypothetical protein